MGRAKYSCPSCGAPVVAARWDAGYEYCKDKKCFDALGRRTSVYESMPDPDTVDLDPYDLDDVASMYGEGD